MHEVLILGHGAGHTPLIDRGVSTLRSSSMPVPLELSCTP
jgi:hypothetical protein